MELANLQSEFDKLGVKLVVVSTDHLDTHGEWKKTMESLTYKDRKTPTIKFPLVADENLAIAKKYGMIHPQTNSTKSVRGVFIIDPNDIIQAIYFYPMAVGRNTNEIIRTVQALQTVAADKVSTPANWKLGDDLLVPIPPKTALNDPKLAPEGYYNLAWFMWFKKIN